MDVREKEKNKKGQEEIYSRRSKLEGKCKNVKGKSIWLVATFVG